jgi:hypothetical protein
VETSPLPKEPDREFLDNLCLNLIRERLGI